MSFEMNHSQCKTRDKTGDRFNIMVIGKNVFNKNLIIK